MSYTITVRTQDGVTAVTVAGQVPDGEHEIYGHAANDEVSLGVRQRGPDGRFVARAEHSHATEG